MAEVFQRLRGDALLIFEAGLEAASPAVSIEKSLILKNRTLHVGPLRYDLDSFEKIYLIGGGKASAEMAVSLSGMLGKRIADSAVSVPYGQTRSLDRVRILEGSHPVPDGNCLANTKELLRLADKATEKDLIICLISGGCSSLLAAPPEGITLTDLVDLNMELLICGADIKEINTVRKHISAIKGGRLQARINPATALTLIVSDVPGDELTSIGSGPTVPDTTTYGDSLQVIQKYGLQSRIPGNVLRHIHEGVDGILCENPGEKDHVFSKARSVVIADNATSVEAASSKAKSMGYSVYAVPTPVVGGTREASLHHVQLVKESLERSKPSRYPACIVSGGETTVRVTGKGRGGRNQEFVLQAALEISGLPAVVLSADTDGVDGATDAAGAICDGDTLKRAAELGLDPVSYLRENDSYTFFEKLHDLVKTGDTGTNVMDIHIATVVDREENL